jgi:hypothetical protein
MWNTTIVSPRAALLFYLFTGKIQYGTKGPESSSVLPSTTTVLFAVTRLGKCCLSGVRILLWVDVLHVTSHTKKRGTRLFRSDVVMYRTHVLLITSRSVDASSFSAITCIGDMRTVLSQGRN